MNPNARLRKIAELAGKLADLPMRELRKRLDIKRGILKGKTRGELVRAILLQEEWDETPPAEDN